jgi:hypothetical protein
LDRPQPAALHFKPEIEHPNQTAVCPQQQAVDAQGQFDQVQVPHSFGSLIQQAQAPGQGAADTAETQVPTRAKPAGRRGI